MKAINTREFSKPVQHLLSLSMVLVVASICFPFADVVNYKVDALILLMTVSVVAMLFDIWPVLGAAILSSVIWNFFFIPPIFTFHINKAEDLLMFCMYFLIAMVNATLTFKIRQAEMKARDREEKENTIRLYANLLNSLSHELRTPVATIIGSVDTLKENKAMLSQANQAELLTQISTAGLRLNGQIENLLNMSRLESGMLQLHYDWCDMNELVFSTVEKLTPSGIGHTIEFAGDEKLPLFKVDAGLVEQILHNIIYNALLYTPLNSIITIDISRDVNNCIIIIADNGTGFPPDEMPFAFDKFYRLRHTKTGGSGLGLSIAKGFAEAHNGNIKLENSKNGGAQFTVSIPAEQSFINNLKHE